MLFLQSRVARGGKAAWRTRPSRRIPANSSVTKAALRCGPLTSNNETSPRYSSSECRVTLSSSSAWIAAVNSFHEEYQLYVLRRSSALRIMHVAESAMSECLAARRAREAMEVYQVLCQCGLVGLSYSTGYTPSRRDVQPAAARRCSGSLAKAGTLDQLAQQATLCLPHHKQLHANLELLMAAELDLPLSAAVCDRGTIGKSGLLASDECVLKMELDASSLPLRSSGLTSTTFGGSEAEMEEGAVSTAEQTRVRVQRRLLTLCSTQQLRQALGKEYCLVELHHIGASAPSAALSVEVEVDPLRTLSHVVLHHPFTHAKPSVEWARQELLWEEVRTHTVVSYLTPADVRRLTSIEDTVAPYRTFCRSSLEFLASFVPHWDDFFVRRVAETLVLPASAHSVFPEFYQRSWTAARKDAVAAAAGVPTKAAAEEPASAASVCTSWTNTAEHRLFESTVWDEVCCGEPASPFARVESIVKRRVHHDIVVPDTLHILQNFHQLRQLARHREVVVTHGVFLDLVAATSLPAHPIRFHARRVLRDIMHATTTALTAQISSEGAEVHFDPRSVVSAARRRHQKLNGFTLLGLQDELAVLEHCPERFYLSETDAFSSPDPASAPSNWALRGDWMRHDRPMGTDRTTPCANKGDRNIIACSLSVVLVAKQLERMILAHDRGECFFKNDEGRAMPPRAPDDVQSLVQHVMAGQSTNALECPLTVHRPPSPRPLFSNRSRGLWSRLPVVVATTLDATRTAAFMVGLTMHPPAGVAS